MRFSINIQGSKSQLMTILDLFRGGSAAIVSLVIVAQTDVVQIYYLHEILGIRGSAILVVPLGVTNPLII